MTTFGETQEITLRDGFRTFVVRTTHATVEIRDDGHVTVHSDTEAEQHPALPLPKPVAQVFCEPQAIGQIMPDLTVYAGRSPDTGRPLYTTAFAAPIIDDWRAAKRYAATLSVCGHRDWRMPSRTELKTIFDNAATIGNVDISGNYPLSWFWSSEADPGIPDHAWMMRLDNALPISLPKSTPGSLRCVRG